MSVNLFSRRSVLAALVLPALLAACGGGEMPEHYDKLSWDYLPPLKLKVASVDIDNSWTPVSAARDKGFLAPTPPVEALRRMAEQRLVAVGASGRAQFTIIDASILQQRGDYVGSFIVRLAILGADGGRRAYAEARVSRRRTIDDDDDEGVRRELNDMIRQMMADMNVEFEYQIRHSLKAFLQFTADKAPAPEAVEEQNLAAPGAAEPDVVDTPATAPASNARPAAPSAPSAIPFSSPAPTVLAP